jgi:type IV secretory pathway VirB3-like protein
MNTKNLKNLFKRPKRIFGVRMKTPTQKRFMVYFIIFKAIVSIAILVLFVIFLLKLRAMKGTI